MFVRARVLLVVASAALALVAVHPTTGAGDEPRYVVRPGDTLWTIATARYAGDPREAIWRIERRNRLESAALSPGQVLALPP
ncbi:MAG: LysM peptidoglycan-binding domain-containing protein [Actinomycetota bacterium]|nr:LysM peptidoglycan-binding domain-containing protein [Actinomycetota bacterium]